MLVFKVKACGQRPFFKGGTKFPMLHTVSLKSVYRFEIFFFFFGGGGGVTIYRHGDNLGHVTWTLYTNFASPVLTMIHVTFEFDLSSGF